MSESSRNRSSADEQLRRIFSLAPILHARPGITLKELREASGFPTRKDLRKALERLMMFGVPPYSPSDFLTVTIDDRERVFLDFPQGLERPLALTAAEWSAVQRRIQAELEFRRAGDPAAEELREILGRIASFPVEFEAGDTTRSKRELVQEALEDEIQIEFLYRTLASKEPELRRIDPWAMFQQGGVSYVIGYCHLRRAPRFFHLERLESLELLDLPREESPPENLTDFMRQSPIFRNVGEGDAPAGFTAEIAFRPDLRAALEISVGASNVRPLETTPGEADRLHARDAERLSGEDAARPDRRGWLRAECRVSDSLWFRSAIRGFGEFVQILKPDFLRADFLDDLRSIPAPAPLD